MSSAPTTDRIIGIVRENGYRLFLGWAPKDDNHLGDVHVAHFSLPGRGSIEAYAKFYPCENGHNRGLVNEITGYLCGHALGIPQPDIAFIADIPLGRLPRATGWLAGVKKKRKTYPAFCTLRLDGHSAAVRVPDSLADPVKKEIERWEDLPRAVAMDEHIANTDRHLNNLIRLDRHRFAVIDNGRLANTEGPDWTQASLSPHALYRNRLSEHLWGHRPPESHISKMLDLARHHPVAFAQIRDELEYWWSKLIPDEADHKAFRAFLEERTMNIDALIRLRYNRLL